MSLKKAKQLYETGKNEESFNEFKELLQNQPTTADFYTSFAKLLITINQIQTAEKMASIATKLPDVTTESWLISATIHEKLKMLDTAKVSFEEGLKLDSTHKKLNEGYGLLLRNPLHDYENAVKFLEKSEETPRVLSSLGLCYRGLFNEEKAGKYFLKAIEQDKFFAPTYTYYLNMILDTKEFSKFYDLFNKIYDKKLKSTPTMDILLIGKVLCLFLENRFEEIEGLLEGSPFYTDSSWNNFEFKAVNILIAYRRYLVNLFEYRKKHNNLFKDESDKTIHVVGDSHTLSYAWLNVNNVQIIPHLVMGCKIHHLTMTQENRYREAFKKTILNLPNNSGVIINIGEIDCRDSDVFVSYLKSSQVAPKTYIRNSVKQYIKLIKTLNKEKGLNITICGVQSPKIINFKEASKEFELRLDIIKIINKETKIIAKNNGFNFITAYKPQKDGLGKADDFIDEFHLKPAVYASMVDCL